MDCEETAKAWAATAKKHADVTFWAYTRSHWWAHHFAGLTNFALYLSIDPVNKADVLTTYNKLSNYKNISLAWMDSKPSEKPEGIKFIGCPSSKGLKMANGKKRDCKDCRLCFTHNDNIKLRHISFSIH